MTRVGVVVVLFVVGLVSRLAAHPMQFSYVDIVLSPVRTDVSITVHTLDAAHDLGLASEAEILAAGFVDRHGTRLAELLASRLTLRADEVAMTAVPVDVSVVADEMAVVVRLRYPAVGARARLGIAGWLFPYDPVHQTFIKVYDAGTLVHQDILSATRTAGEYAVGSTQGRGDVFRRFVLSGIQHIAIGPDHVLFLVGLLLLGGSVWQLVRIVTGFTVAHSVTLTLAALDLVSPPTRLVEAAIALSICYVGVDNLIRRPGRADYRIWIAFGFGLVHGFGFANVLREMDLPRGFFGWSLFAFNVGVEIGQLVIVAVVASLLAWVARTREALHRRVVIAGSVVVIWAGFYWFVERVFFA